MPDYIGTFEKGEEVRVVSREALERFVQSWHYHHPLQENQLQYASKQATVRDVSFYHGGATLYDLTGIPGIWHEVCLEDPTIGKLPPAAQKYSIESELRDGKTYLIVHDSSGQVCYCKERSLWKNGDLQSMNAILQSRSTDGFARRFKLNDTTDV